MSLRSPSSPPGPAVSDAQRSDRASALLAVLEGADREQRWRLLLGPGAAPDAPTRASGDEPPPLAALPDGALSDADAALGALYGNAAAHGPREGSLGRSRPRLLRWLGELESLFPPDVAHALRAEAISRHRLEALLLEPALRTSMEPDAGLLARLVDLAQRLPTDARGVARERIRELVEALTAELAPSLGTEVDAALRSLRTGPLRTTRSLDLRRTVRDNLRHWDPATRRLGISRLRFRGTATHQLPVRLILALDTSGSMEASKVHGALTAGILSSLPTLDTRVILFDTALVDLSDQTLDPVELLLSTQLGGGTDLAGAIGHCASLVEDPSRTVLILLSDLHESGRPEPFLGQLAALRSRGVRCLCLLALQDQGGRADHADHAEAVSALGIPTLALTPSRLPGILAALLRGEPVDDAVG